jgi:hypothetical protein
MRSDIEIAISALDKFQNMYTLSGFGWSRPIRGASLGPIRIRLQRLTYKPVLQIAPEAEAKTCHGD